MKSRVVEGKPILENMRVFCYAEQEEALFNILTLPNVGSLCLSFLAVTSLWPALLAASAFVFQLFFLTFTLIFRKDKCIVAEPVYKA